MYDFISKYFSYIVVATPPIRMSAITFSIEVMMIELAYEFPRAGVCIVSAELHVHAPGSAEQFPVFFPSCLRSHFFNDTVKHEVNLPSIESPPTLWQNWIKNEICGSRLIHIRSSCHGKSVARMGA